MDLKVDLKENSYPIIIKKGVLNHLSDYLDIKGKVLIVSDDLIPNKYISLVASYFKNAYIKIFAHGEDNKSLETYKDILLELSNNNFTRKDSIIALGGGLTSDIAGFAASSYMRGISFYIIPTTLLSQVDASIGGKVAINFNNYKNLVGAFYQPKKVIIDPDTLDTLSHRLKVEGLAEIIKMSLTNNEDLFNYIENSEDVFSDPEYLISESLKIKKEIVEKDEKENNIRQILNFGHTLGHALEALSDGKLYHGEAVAIGMTYFTSKEVRDRLIKVLEKYNLPYQYDFDIDEVINKIKLDKKSNNDDSINIVYVDKIGEGKIIKISFDKLKDLLLGGRL